MESRPIYLAKLGVYGFDQVEPVLLAGLVTEDPMLLIGQMGTGKTYLLNTLSEAMGLEHRHYNASLISFDDLVGFPYPDEERGSVRFLETPATVWGAESVLIDEISRCRPEHQNRLFSLVHERRVQGISLPKLRYRWAAMNPCSGDQSSVDDYAGSEPLDPALADRFALFVETPGWSGLSDEARTAIAQPGGEGRIAADGGVLAAQIRTWREQFEREVDRSPDEVVAYAVAAASALNGAGVSISPRRARLLARSLLAASIAKGGRNERVFRMVLEASIPHRCWGVSVRADVLAAAHEVAWASIAEDEASWIHRFHAEPDLARKLGILLAECRNPDHGTQAVAQLMVAESRERSAAFAFAVYPAAAAGKLPIGTEGVNDLGNVAGGFLSTDGMINWQERYSESGTQHPDYSRYAAVVEQLKGARRERARQFFNACLVLQVIVGDPPTLEAAIEGCVLQIRRHDRVR